MNLKEEYSNKQKKDKKNKQIQTSFNRKKKANTHKQINNK